MGFDVLNTNATVTIGLQGLAVVCHNEAFNNGQGRWELAIPRFEDHHLTIEIDGIGTIRVDPKVKFIEIKDRVGVTTKPKHEVGDTFDRKKLDQNDKNDFRWVTDYMNDKEIPHGEVLIKKKDANGNQGRADITMLYVYDALFYTKQIVPTGAGILVCADQKLTGPIGKESLSDPIEAAKIGQALETTGDFGFSASTLGMDIQSPRGGAVDIIFDKAITATIPQGDKPREILIVNREPTDAPTTSRFVETEDFEFGRGDFFRYYELFEVKGSQLDLWEKHPRGKGPGPGKTGDCNKVRVELANLDELL